MRCAAACGLVAVLAPGVPAAAATGDPLLDVLASENGRTLKHLALPGQPKPYYLALTHVDVDTFVVTGRLGSVVENQTTKLRYVTARMRVGSSELDNTNFIGRGGGGRGSVRRTTDGLGPEGVRDPVPVARSAWRAADEAYKGALEMLAAKQAALRREPQPDRPPDFAPVSPVIHLQPEAATDALALAAVPATVRRASAVFRDAPGVQRGEVRVSGWTNTVRFSDSEGFRHRRPDHAVRVLVTAETQADDGTPLRDVRAFMAPDLASLRAAGPAESVAREVAERLTRRASAPELERPYLGPVLFSALAAAEMIRQTLAEDLCGTPSPVASDSYLKSAVSGGQLARFLGLRVLPTWMDVASDPLAESYNGTPLIGHYAVDREGVRAERVELVANGRLRRFCRSRTPSKGAGESNGHGRIVAGHMVRAAPANLFVTARRTEPWSGLVRRLRRLARVEGLEYGLLVRHLNEPAVGGGGPRRVNLGTGEEDAEDSPSRWVLSPALDIVKVDVATGEEQPLRGALFGPVGVVELRSLVAAGRDTAVYSFLLRPQRRDYGQGSAERAAVSIVAPSLLFSQLEVRSLGGSPKPLPILPRPLPAGSAGVGP